MTIEELDHAAAREVMGWALWHSVAWLGDDAEIPMDRNEWSPTMKESHASMLREKIRAEGWEITAVSHKRGDTVTMEKRGVWCQRQGEAGSMPRVLTEAAVEAKRLEKEA